MTIDFRLRQARKVIGGTGRVAAAVEIGREDRERALLGLSRTAFTVALIEATAGVDQQPELWAAMLADARRELAASPIPASDRHGHIEWLMNEYLREFPNSSEIHALDWVLGDLDAGIAAPMPVKTELDLYAEELLADADDNEEN
ncbi:hypothetical protein [Gordonia alkaliphila]|uniref:Uncharacterized protein n=1 Tax=Gordonia alkaliphila TaxID=1053547 RepID=A0ABP8YYR1_9ACTN